jgi:uncharacterized protein
MTIDSLTFLGESLLGRSVETGELLALLEQAGVEGAVACPAKPRGYRFEAANEAVAAAVRAHPGRLAGLVRVDPNLDVEAQTEAERGLTELGLRGLFLHPWEETFRVDDPRVDAVVEVARAYGAPVVVESGYPWLSEGLQVGALARRFPTVTFIATNGLQINMSGLGQTDAELALSDNPNLLIHTSGVYREDFLQRIVAQHGPNRVLFASAFPRFDPGLEILRVEWADFTAVEREAMLEGNARRLFGL